jgi:hypothetical protein
MILVHLESVATWWVRQETLPKATFKKKKPGDNTFVLTFISVIYATMLSEVSKGRGLLTSELEKMWKEDGMPYSEVLSWHLSLGTEEYHSTFSQDIWYPRQDSNQPHSQYKSIITT